MKRLWRDQRVTHMRPGVVNCIDCELYHDVRPLPSQEEQVAVAPLQQLRCRVPCVTLVATLPPSDARFTASAPHVGARFVYLARGLAAPIPANTRVSLKKWHRIRKILVFISRAVQRWWEAGAAKLLPSAADVTREADLARLMDRLSSFGSFDGGAADEYADDDDAATTSCTYRLAESQIKSIAYQLLAGIKHCHERRFAHRDLTLKNVLVDGDTNVFRADFGLARVKETQEEDGTLDVVTLECRATVTATGRDGRGGRSEPCGSSLVSFALPNVAFTPDPRIFSPGELDLVDRFIRSRCSSGAAAAAAALAGQAPTPHPHLGRDLGDRHPGRRLGVRMRKVAPVCAKKKP